MLTAGAAAGHMVLYSMVTWPVSFRIAGQQRAAVGSVGAGCHFTLSTRSSNANVPARKPAQPHLIATCETSRKRLHSAQLRRPPKFAVPGSETLFLSCRRVAF